MAEPIVIEIDSELVDEDNEEVVEEIRHALMNFMAENYSALSLTVAVPAAAMFAGTVTAQAIGKTITATSNPVIRSQAIHLLRSEAHELLEQVIISLISKSFGIEMSYDIQRGDDAETN